VKTLNLLKKPFGQSDFSPIRHARYLAWEDAFEFKDGLCFLEPHDAIRRANRIAAGDQPVGVNILHSSLNARLPSASRILWTPGLLVVLITQYEKAHSHPSQSRRTYPGT